MHIMSNSVQVLNCGKIDCIIFKPSLLNGCILIGWKISSDGNYPTSFGSLLFRLNQCYSKKVVPTI